ncbi:MAG: SDR family oxidoreductase [Phycisphaerales bacterium]
MDLLILGGTGFLGPHTVRAAQQRGHKITLFNRGRTNPQLFPGLEQLQGDRDPKIGDGLKALTGRRWDAVIDTSGYLPRLVRTSAELLGPNVTQYVFISTVSVYADFSKPGIVETDAVATLEDDTIEQITGETYGPLKALCEQAVEAAMPGRVTNIRPGLIVGPGDPTDRFTYWPVRIDRGGEVLAPRPKEAPVQFIDVRDLAQWIVKVIEDGHAGVYNATGPRAKLTMAQMLYGCRAATSSAVSFTWVAPEFLLEQGVKPWTELPQWLPGENDAGQNQVNIERALNLGLTFRPLADTARDTIQWHKETRGPGYDFGATEGSFGMKAQRETAILAAWHAR